MSESDAATNYLGWTFYRDSGWTWPPAANPAYGMDIAGSILMADANPLLAMPFKLLSPLLPEPFQYFGWWLLACFLLQGLFAQGIAARITPHGEQRLAIVALFLYSLLPIVRNTHAGLTGIAPDLRDSAAALGLTARATLWEIELPLASRSILAGIKTSAVINIGTATLGALIGAGGYGEPILTGIRLDSAALILEGAIPAALMALAAQLLFGLAERWLVPRGLRIGKSGG